MLADELSRAVGKLITGRVAGTALEPDYLTAITSGVMSGVTLFKENASDLEGLLALIDDMRKAGGQDFIVAVDQEGGAVQRFDKVFCSLPSAMAMAASGDQECLTGLLSTAARQLRLLGVNVNLSPVLDINSNPLNPIIGTRSFGDRLETIVRLASQVVAAHAAEGVVCAGKHFPGHGDTAEDSHLKLAVCRANRNLLEKRELQPFFALSKLLKALLVGHIWLAAIDAKPLPASLSPAVIDILRQEIGFDGWLLTDDLPVMKAIMDNWGIEEACVLAVQAGVDNLLISGSLEQIRQAHAAVVGAVRKGTISEESVKQSLARRRRALSSTAQPEGTAAERLVQLTELTRQLAPLSLRTASSAIALWQGSVPNIAHSPSDFIIISPVHARYDLALSKRLHICCGCLVKEVRYGLDPEAAEIEEISAQLPGKRAVLLTFQALLHPGQLHLAERVGSLAAEATAIALDVPYELNCLKNFSNLLATFDPSTLAMQALAMVLALQATPKGSCPVQMAKVAALNLKTGDAGN